MSPAKRAGAAAEVEEEDQVDESHVLAAAMERELAALESQLPGEGEEAPSEVELPARQLHDLSMLAPGEESIPLPREVDATFDGPLTNVPFADQLADAYHVELSRFLLLWAQQRGVTGRVENREAVLKLAPGMLHYEAPEGEVRLPLTEDTQMEACLRRRQHVVNPSLLLAWCLGNGAVTALKAAPVLSEAGAREILTRLHPDRLGSSKLELVHEAFAQVNYQVTLRYYRKEEKTFSVLYGLGREVPAGALDALITPERWLAAEASSVSNPEAIARVEAQARNDIGRRVRERQAVIQREIDQDVRENVKILDDYYQEKAKELEDEKKAVYFHLYYFEKEEAIDKQLVKMKREKEDRSRAMERFWDVRVDTRLLSVGHFEVPFWRAVEPRCDGLAVDALAGVAYYRDNGYWLVEQD